MSPEDLVRLLTTALERAGEPEVEAYASFARRGIARFAVGDLGQHMQLEEPSAVVRVAHGKRVAEVSADLALDSLLDAISTGARIARQLPEDESFPGFATADEPAPPEVRRYSSVTAAAGPEHRAALLRPAFERVARAGLLATGTLATTTEVEAVVTTGGLARSYGSTLASYKVWALESAGAGGASGHGMRAGTELTDCHIMEETEHAVEDALRSKNPGSLPAGRYDTVLGPLAVAELVEWLSMIAFGARELEQGVSPFAKRLGERITSSDFTVLEDPFGPLALTAPFDREGVARRRQVLIDAGVARGVVHDRASAKRAGAHSTGNAAAPDGYGAGGPTPSALVVSGGSARGVDELIAGMDRGLYVRRLHYVNGLLEPRRAVMTGLTRDGTFLVEHGKIVRAIESLRFTDSLLEALERSDGMTAERVLVPNWWSAGGSVAAPGVRVRNLTFSSGSRPT